MVKKALVTYLTLGAAFVGLPSAVFAQTTNENISVDAQAAGFKITDASKLIKGILQFVIFVVGLLVFAYLIWGGIEWITAGGDKSKTESARQKITNAIIGLAIVASAFAISQILTRFFGINIGTQNLIIPQAY